MPSSGQEKRKMFCRNCSAPVQEGAYACLNCGLPPMLGKAHCQNCGASTHPDAVICVKCGVKLGSSPFSANMNFGQKGGSINLGNKAGLIGSIMVFIGFLLPWIDISYASVSGFSAVFGSLSQELGGERFLLLILPISSGLFLYHLFTQKLDKGLANFLKFAPLLFIIISAFVLYAKINEGRHGDFDGGFGRHSEDIFKIIGVGFWLTLVGAIVMCFDLRYNPQAINKQREGLQTVNKGGFDFSTMNKQRKFVLLAAVVGSISCFLPWFSISISYVSTSIPSINGMHSWGLLAFFGFIGAGVGIFLGDKTKTVEQNYWLITLACGALSALGVIVSFILQSDQIERYVSLGLNYSFGFGIFIAAIAAAGVPAFGYMFRSPDDSINGDV